MSKAAARQTADVVANWCRRQTDVELRDNSAGTIEVWSNGVFCLPERFRRDGWRITSAAPCKGRVFCILNRVEP